MSIAASEPASQDGRSAERPHRSSWVSIGGIPYESTHDACPFSPMPFRFGVEQFEQLLASGIMGREQVIELWHGQLLRLPIPGPEHAAGVSSALSWLSRRKPAGWHIRVQVAMVFDDSVVFPDLAVVRGSLGDTRKPHRMQQDVALIVEVAEHSVEFDRSRRAELYAAHGVPEVWIVDPEARQVEIFRSPAIGEDGAARYFEAYLAEAGMNVLWYLDGKLAGEIPVEELAKTI